MFITEPSHHGCSAISAMSLTSMILKTVPHRYGTSFSSRPTLFPFSALFIATIIGSGFYVMPFDHNLSFWPKNPIPVDAIPDIGENQQIVCENCAEAVAPVIAASVACADDMDEG